MKVFAYRCKTCGVDIDLFLQKPLKKTQEKLYKCKECKKRGIFRVFIFSCAKHTSQM